MPTFAHAALLVCVFGARSGLSSARGVAQLERDIIAERTKAGLAAARRRRVQLGQPKVRDAKNLARAKRLRKSGRSLRYIAGLLDCSMRELLGYREKSP